MDVPNPMKGEFYPSNRVSRCPRFSRCTVSNKCQNYDRHLLECNVCESRTNTHEVDPVSVPLGGYLPEGEYHPDMQDALQQLERLCGRPFSHPDAVPTTQSGADIASKFEKEKKIADMVAMFSRVGPMQMEEVIMQALVNEDTAKLLGRIE